VTNHVQVIISSNKNSIEDIVKDLKNILVNKLLEPYRKIQLSVKKVDDEVVQLCWKKQ